MTSLTKLADRFAGFLVPKARARAANCTWVCKADCQVWRCCTNNLGNWWCDPYGGDGCC